MNKVILMGRLVADPEFSVAQTGMPFCRFRIAVDRPVSTRQGEQKQSDFFNVTCFNKAAELVNQYFVKGKPILIDGRIENSNYIDKNGVQHYGCQVIADKVNFVLSDPTRNNQSYGNGYNNNYGYNSNNGYQNNSYNNSNGYNGNYGYQNNSNYYQQPAPQNPVPQQNSAPQQFDDSPKDVELGDIDISDFEAIISDGQVPF
ncbi:MAG: single-stranded DNA-binding protein [Oscillospiraceae bacterium]|nr:single-stranded DNA-binding protein [Oscillospiraceae bacterium]